MTRGVVAAKCPRPLPDGIHEALRARLAEDYVVDTVVFDASAMMPSQSPLHEMASLQGIAGSSIGTIADFLEKPDLADTAFIIHGISTEQIQTWGYLLRAVSSERLKNPPAAGPYLMIFSPAGLKTEAEKRLIGQVKTKIWRGYMSSWIRLVGSQLKTFA